MQHQQLRFKDCRVPAGKAFPGLPQDCLQLFFRHPDRFLQPVGFHCGNSRGCINRQGRFLQDKCRRQRQTGRHACAREHFHAVTPADLLADIRCLSCSFHVPHPLPNASMIQILRQFMNSTSAFFRSR